jgi:hypothetical protein
MVVGRYQTGDSACLATTIRTRGFPISLPVSSTTDPRGTSPQRYPKYLARTSVQALSETPLPDTGAAWLSTVSRVSAKKDPCRRFTSPTGTVQRLSPRDFFGEELNQAESCQPPAKLSIEIIEIRILSRHSFHRLTESRPIFDLNQSAQFQNLLR